MFKIQPAHILTIVLGIVSIVLIILLATKSNCPAVGKSLDPLFSTIISPFQYTPQDFVVYTTSTSDLPGQPMRGNLNQCINSCNNDTTCVGFSRSKSVNNDASGECWLKKDITNNRRTFRDPRWITYTKGVPPPPTTSIITSPPTTTIITSPPTTTLKPRKNPNDLPINRYPFVGSHDSAAYQTNLDLSDLGAALMGQVPLVLCQELNFVEQYTKGGCKFFDLRCILDKNQTEIRFAHGPIPLQLLNQDSSFERLLKEAIKNNDLLLLNVDAEKSGSELPKIMELWNKYVTNKNFVNKCYFINSLDDLKRSVGSYINSGKNILFLKNEHKVGNWDGSQQCFPVNVEFFENMEFYDEAERQQFLSSWWKKITGTASDIADKAKKEAEEAKRKAEEAAEAARRKLVIVTDPCIQSCLPDKNNPKPLNKLYKHVSDKYTEYLNKNPEKIWVIQAFWQASTEGEQVARTVSCFIQKGSGIKSTSVNTEKITKLNEKMYSLFVSNMMIPNVVIFDNVGECTKKLADAFIYMYTNNSVPSLTC